MQSVPSRLKLASTEATMILRLFPVVEMPGCGAAPRVNLVARTKWSRSAETNLPVS